jgi:L-rhamnose isomerase
MSYNEAKKKYARIGVDTEKVLADLANIPISMHCWQGDDVCGFENELGATGGIQATGNYPGKARTPAELIQDIELAFSLIP